MTEEGKSKALRLALDEEDWHLLERVAQKEKLTKSDILRRGLRRYAAEIDSASSPDAQPSVATG